MVLVSDKEYYYPFLTLHGKNVLITFCVSVLFVNILFYVHILLNNAQFYTQFKVYLAPFISGL